MAAAAPFDNRPGEMWMNGEFIPWSDAQLHVLSHALHYASSVFEGERAYGGKIFKLREHTERLFKSAEILDMEIPYTVEEIDNACIELLQRQGLKDAYVRPVAWRGSEMMGVSAQSRRSTSPSPSGNGQAISTPSSASRASASTWPSGAGPTRQPHHVKPRRPACT
jgi:branched-subunit amino acid aminotransferase/4-amino-4-deoxychorismate lyase